MRDQTPRELARQLARYLEQCHLYGLQRLLRALDADPSPSVETPPPCENCGNEERTGAGYLTCECPDQAFVERPRITPAPSPLLDPVALSWAEQVLAKMEALMQPQPPNGRYLGAAETWNTLLAWIRDQGSIQHPEPPAALDPVALQALIAQLIDKWRNHKTKAFTLLNPLGAEAVDECADELDALLRSALGTTENRS